MKGDFSRSTFRREKHYSRVLMQQGRVQLDADWNEQQAINQTRLETEARDVIGLCGAPVDNAGFEISVIDETILIGKGRYYVDGILCENETEALRYDDQPDFPDAPDWIPQLAETGASWGLVYLDVWQRHITALDDPLIREKALGGPDTTTRLKTVWQVKVMPLTERDGVTCDDSFTALDELQPIGTGSLNARTQQPNTVKSPCILPPTAGYRRLENQLYRVEIHRGGPLGKATFKWSRDNGTIVTGIDKIDGQEITVQDLGPDDMLGFASGQWVEIIDDQLELGGIPGQLAQIKHVNTATRVITLLEPVEPLSNTVDGVDKTLHPKLRRWDQTGATAGTNGVNVVSDWVALADEDGIEVQFSDEGDYKTGDYWLIPARTATGEIEWPPYETDNDPKPQPPLGIQHHYCRLALVRRGLEQEEFRTAPGSRFELERIYEGDLLESYEASPDHTTWTFIFNPDATMPDGPPVTAYLVKELFKTSPRLRVNLSLASVVDDLTLQVELIEPNSHLNEDLVEVFIAGGPQAPAPNFIDCRSIFSPLSQDWPTVVDINWPNDQDWTVDEFEKRGLKVYFSEEIVEETLNLNTFIVTLELPREGPLNGYDPFIIHGEVTYDSSCVPPYTCFNADSSVITHLKGLLGTPPEHGGAEQIRCRVVLKGNAILAEEKTPGYPRPLDGDVFGFFDGERNDIMLPSGDGIKGGDFESWFYLYLPPPPP